MEEGESVALLSRKELRKQKLMEYLVAKGKLTDSHPKSSCPHGDSVSKKPLSSKGMVFSGKENKTVVDRFGHGQTKALSQSSIKPHRSVLGVNNKVNVKNGVQTGQQGTHLKRPTDTFAQPHLKPTIKRSNTALQPATSLSRNLSNTRALSSVWKSSKPEGTVRPISVSRSSSSKTAWSGPMNTASSRISLGCLVKTRTGLVPAMTQSLHTSSQSLARNSALTTSVPKAAAAEKSRYKTTSTLVTVCKRPVAAQKSLPSSAPGKASRDKNVMTAADDRKPKVPAKPSSRPPVLPPKSQTTNGLKSTCSTSSCAAPLNRTKGTTRVTTSYQSDRRPTGSATRRMFERDGNKNIPQVNASFRLSNQVTASSCRGFDRSTPAATAAKENSSIPTHTKKGQSIVNGRPPQVGLRRTVTVPQPPRITSHTRKATVTTATKALVKAAPHTEGAKLTAAQEERMRKLKEWREAKGISYKRPPMQVKAQFKPPAGELQPSNKDEVDSLISTLDRALSDCIKLVEEGSPAEEVRAILSRLPPVSRKFTKFWICQARLMEREGNLDVLPMFKEAVGVVLEPLDELRMVVFEILKKNEQFQVPTPDGAEEKNPGDQSSAGTFTSLLMTPKPITELIGGEKGASSVIKYRVTTTPGRPPRQQQEPRRFNGKELRILTPVRRSSRIHKGSIHHPESLREHDLCVTSYEELLHGAGGAEEDKPVYLYVGNEALGDNVSVQLVSLPPAESANHG